MRLDALECVSRRAFLAAVLIVPVWLALTAGDVRAQSAGTPAITVIAPQAAETVHDNNGTIAVEVSLQGAALTEGRRLRALIDGWPFGGDQATVRFVLNDIDRGEHTLQVLLLDAKGVVITTSVLVTFHMWRASALSPLRKPAPSQVK